VRNDGFNPVLLLKITNNSGKNLSKSAFVVMMNKNSLGYSIDMNNSRMVDVMNGQTGDLSLTLT